MDRYRIVAICENDSTSRQLVYLPENFEGVKITREFSFAPPYGFTPKMAVKTMRLILSDKVWLNSKNDLFGYFLRLKLVVSELNADGRTYTHLMNLIVNNETIKKDKDFVEFSVDVVNSATDYLNSRATIRNIEMPFYLKPVGDYFKMNNVNLNSKSSEYSLSGTYYVPFEKSEKLNVIFDEDLSLYEDISTENDTIIYRCETIGTIDIMANIAFTFLVATPQNEVPRGTISAQIVRGADVVWQQNKNVTWFQQSLYFDHSLKIQIPFTTAENIRLRFVVSGLAPRAYAYFDRQNADFTIKKKTRFKYPTRYLRCMELKDVFTNLFGLNNYVDTDLLGTYITSDREIITSSGTLSVKPQEFVRETSTSFGLVFNFSENETKIENVNTYFDRLDTADRIVIDTHKDLSIKNYETVYNSVTLGVEKNETENSVWLTPFQTKISFKRNLSGVYTTDVNGENMELVCNKLSADSEKISNRIYETTIGNGQNSNDNYYLMPLRTGTYPDCLRPEDFGRNSLAILRLFFYQINTNIKLKAFDNDGIIKEVTEELILKPNINNKCLVPIVYEFTALLGQADFSEHFAQLTDFDGNTVDLFVYSSETTDQLGEIKCKGLVFK